MPPEPLGPKIQREMREAGSSGSLSYAQHQRLKAVATEEELVAFLLAEGILSGQYGKEPSPAAVRRAITVLTSGAMNDQGMLTMRRWFSSKR